MGTPISIPFPVKGLWEGNSYDEQPPLTTPDCLNARARDPLTGRNRGAQRAGTTKYNTNSARILGDSTDRAIQCGISVVKHDDRVTYTARTGTDPASVVSWQKALPGNRDGITIAVDRQSNLFVVAAQAAAATGINYLVKFNSAGARVWIYPIPLAQNTHIVKSVKVDNVGGIYVTIAGTGTAGKVIKFQETTAEEGNLRFVWEVAAPNAALIVDVAIAGNVMYFLENSATNKYLHRFDDVMTANPRPVWGATGVVIDDYSGGAGTNLIPICAAVTNDGGVAVGMVDETDPTNANGAVKKYGPHIPTGSPATAVWTYTGEGVGHAVRCDSSGNIYTCGYGATIFVRKLADSGATVASSRTWSNGAITGLSFSEFKGTSLLDIDRQGNVYYAQYKTAGSAGENAAILFRLTKDADTAAIIVTTTSINAEGYGVVVDPFDTDQESKAEYVYLVTGAVASTFYAVHRLSLLSVTSAEGSPRSLVQLAVINGTIRTFSSGSGAGSTPSGGSAALSTSTKWVVAAAGFNRVLLTDGLVYKSYDVLAGTVADWAATQGQIPRRARLLTIWGSRAVIAGFEDEPQNWAMSAADDFDDWDFFPPNAPLPGQAVLGNNSATGQTPDIITSLLAWSDDLLLAGGDKSINRWTGDPSDGGRIDRVCDIGVAWGMGAMCKDSSGRVYFVGAQGGFYRMENPAALPDEITVTPLSYRFQNINLSTHKVQLVWNDAEKGVHVFLTPFTNTTQTTHYFYDAVNDAWWPDQFAFSDSGAYKHNPLAVWVADGDAPGDRVILLGGQDGYVRYLDKSAKDDDSTAIDSYAFLRVLTKVPGREIKVKNVKVVMGAGVEDATLSAYGIESADFTLITPGSPDWSATISAGRNSGIFERVRGRCVYFRIRNATVARRWALEEIEADLEVAGRARNR